MGQYNNKISMTKYKVSILVPIYNVELYIERCVLSLFNQTYAKSIEYVFVDDCSNDKSISILQSIIDEYPHIKGQIKLVTHAYNKGLSGARETALGNATGEYLLTVDSDDWIELDMVEKLYTATDNSNVDVVSCDYYAEYDRNTIVISQCVGYSPIESLKNIFLGKAHGGTCLRLIRRDLYISNRIHYVNGLNMLEDISVLHKILLHAKTIRHIPIPFYHYYQGNLNSYSTRLSSTSKQNMLDIVPLIEKELIKNSIGDDVWRAFNVFKLRVKSLLIENVISVSEVRSYKSLYDNIRDKELFMMLNKKERLLLSFREKYCLWTYILVHLIRMIKKIRSVIA